jgi:arylamine N-acetyltransferase
MVNIVTISGDRYLVDVGFGANEPVAPIRLDSGHEWEGVAPHRGLLEYRAVAQHGDPAQRLWVYSTREAAGGPWAEMYAFAELEFFPEDYEVMNLRTMTSPTSFFTQTVVAMRTVLDDSGAVGVLTMAKNHVRRRMGDATEVLATLETEEDRIKALEEHFGVKLSQGEQAGIRGLVSEIKS